MSELISYISEYNNFIIPLSIKSINSGAFCNCDLLNSIIISSNVTSIGNGTFARCKLLKYIIIPESIKNIGKNPFAGCKCKIVNNSPYFKVMDNVLYNSEMSNLICYMSESKIFNVPSNVIIIDDNAFWECDELLAINISSNVKYIGNNAFNSCCSLKCVMINSVRINIGNSIFNNCPSLQEIIIPLESRSKFEKLLPDYKDKLKESGNLGIL